MVVVSIFASWMTMPAFGNLSQKYNTNLQLGSAWCKKLQRHIVAIAMYVAVVCI